MWVLLYIVLILCSVIVIPYYVPNEWWIPKEAVYLIGGFSVVAVSMMFPRANGVFANKWIGAIFLYTILSFGWYFFIPLIFPLNGTKTLWNMWNYMPTLNLILGILLIKTLVENTDTNRRWVILSHIICWLSCLFSVVVICQHFGLDQLFSNNPIYEIKRSSSGYLIPNSKIVGFLGNSFLAGNFIAITAPLCLIFKEFRYKVIFVLACIAMYFVDSTVSMIAFISSILLFLILTKDIKKFFIFISFLIITVFVIHSLNPEYFNMSGRESVWGDFFKRCMERFYTGFGLGSFSNFHYTNKHGLIYFSAHNEWIQLLHDGGSIMLALVLGYLIDLGRRILRTQPNMLLIGYIVAFSSWLVISTAGFPLRIASLALIGLLYITCLEVLTKGEVNV